MEKNTERVVILDQNELPLTVSEVEIHHQKKNRGRRVFTDKELVVIRVKRPCVTFDNGEPDNELEEMLFRRTVVSGSLTTLYPVSDNAVLMTDKMAADATDRVTAHYYLTLQRKSPA